MFTTYIEGFGGSHKKENKSYVVLDPAYLNFQRGIGWIQVDRRAQSTGPIG